MEINRFENIAVLGAAGKMGRGILLLNLIHSAQLQHHPENKNKQFIIHAIDPASEQLDTLMLYLKNQIWKWCEKNSALLQPIFAAEPNLDETEQITRYVNKALAIVRPSTRLESAYESRIVFEAVTEQITLKTNILHQINLNNKNNPYFLTNTSSIPIQEIDQKAGLDGNIIGCHFYNPPAVQKLVEVIELPKGKRDISELVNYFCTQLNKTVVASNDVAGFIGNGFFMRDIEYALKLHGQLNKQHSFAQSVHLIDTLTRELMVRPMGIFQLIDYVGIDVCHFIIHVMNQHWQEPLSAPLLTKLLDNNIKGGQNPDGSQKDGLLRYEEGKIKAVLNEDMSTYTSTDVLWPETTRILGITPEDNLWKTIGKSVDRQELLRAHFEAIRNNQQEGNILTINYISAMKNIAHKLYDHHVANSLEDINTVMVTGFHHLYGPWNNYI